MKVYMPKSNPPPRIYFNPHASITKDVVSRILNHYKCDDKYHQNYKTKK